MTIKKLTTAKEIAALKKGDRILVHWGKVDRLYMHEVMFYSIYGVRGDMVICQTKHDHTFKISKFVEGTSQAREVYLVSVEV